MVATKAYQASANAYNGAVNAVKNTGFGQWFSSRFTLSDKMKTYVTNGAAIVLTALTVGK